MPGPQPRHYHPCILLHRREGVLTPPRGRRGRRPLQHNPQGFSLPQTSAAAWGQAALHPTLPHSVGRAFARDPFTPPWQGPGMPGPQPCHYHPCILCIVGRGLDPSAGASGTPPPTTQSAGLLITANVRGGLGAGRPYIPLYHIPWGGPSPATHSRHPVGAGHARPAASPLPPRILCIVGRQATGPLHNRPAPSNTKITCLRPLAGRLFCVLNFSVPFLLRKGTNPRLVKITSGQSPQPHRPAPAGPAGSARPSGR